MTAQTLTRVRMVTTASKTRFAGRDSLVFLFRASILSSRDTLTLLVHVAIIISFV